MQCTSTRQDARDACKCDMLSARAAVVRCGPNTGFTDAHGMAIVRVHWTGAIGAFTNREFLFAPRGRQFSNLVPTPSHSLKNILGHSGIAFSKELIDTNFKKLHNPIFANFVFHTP